MNANNITLSGIIFSILFLIAPNSYSTTLNLTVSNYAFFPANISANVGDTIQWNFVMGFHTTTCDGGVFTNLPAGAAPWNAPIDAGNPTFRYKITVGGTYTYRCNFHAGMPFNMIGNINVPLVAINLNLTSIIEGFWNGAGMIGDTVKVFLRNSTTPFAKVDSAKVKLSISGTGSLAFTHAATGSYYIVVTHRNSIDTWTKNPQALSTSSTASYDFTTAAAQAYGDNLILKSGKYTIYSADVNRDGLVNLNDIVLISNNATNFINGYVVTDVNGDNITNLNDILISFNNSNLFVRVKSPLTPAPDSD